MYSKSVSCGLHNREPRNLLPCSAGIDQCAIQADGSLTPCNYWSGYRCGNVRAEKFTDVWRNSPQLKLVRALRSIPVTEIEQCGGCKYSIFCQGGCRAIAYASTGRLTGFDPSCPHFEKRSSRLGQLPVLN